jgi:lipoprotein-anchoring transpeptidase ErfK/SrfK
VVFGNKDQSDKRMQGDRLTPEGTFKITSKRSPYKWEAIMVLDYPNKESWAKFKRRKAAGEVPSNANPGNGIAIHGTWPGSEWVVDNYVNWTEGCISLKNEDLRELYGMLTVGSTVTIKR